jgi:hypothetical protein
MDRAVNKNRGSRTSAGLIVSVGAAICFYAGYAALNDTLPQPDPAVDAANLLICAQRSPDPAVACEYVTRAGDLLHESHRAQESREVWAVYFRTALAALGPCGLGAALLASVFRKARPADEPVRANLAQTFAGLKVSIPAASLQS